VPRVRVFEVPRRAARTGWEVKLEPPVSRVLPLGQTDLARPWAAFGEKRNRPPLVPRPS
jgi:hypothetical protein